MEKNETTHQIYESKSILGELYRQVDCDFYFENCIRQEHKFTIEVDYTLNEHIINDQVNFFPFLVKVFKEIVKPMEEDLKNVMESNNISNEAELFSTNFTFKMNDETGRKYIGDPSKKEEDVVKNVQTRIEDLKKKYLKIVRSINNYDNSFEHARPVAAAIYFATYYHRENNSY